MPTIRQPQKRNSIDKKRRIVEAGLKVFGEVGYYKTNTAEIAKEAGVSTGIVYSYFKDKKDILMQALYLYFDSTIQPLQKAISESFLAAQDKESAVHWLLKCVLQSHIQHAKLHEELFALCLTDKDVGALYLERESMITAHIKVYLQKAGASPEHIHEKAQLAYELVEQYCHNYLYHRHAYIDYDVLEDMTVKLILSVFHS